MMKEKVKAPYRSLYEYLKKQFKSNNYFTLEELSTATGYKRASVGVYVRNRLLNKYVITKDEMHYTSINFDNIEYSEFRAYMSQKSGRRNENTLSELLKYKSLHAMTAAIEIYNKPIFKYKIESFVILFINAWELLLKAILIDRESERAIFYDDKKERTLSITDALKKVFPDSANPQRQNIETIIEVRDSIVHFCIPSIESELSRFLQAGVLNYFGIIRKIGVFIDKEMYSTGFMNFVTYPSELNQNNIRLEYGEVVQKNIKSIIELIKGKEESIKSVEYAIPIEYRLVLSKKSEDGDITISIGKEGTPTSLLKIAKDINETHPYSSSKVMSIINERLKIDGKEMVLNSFAVQSIIFSEKVKNQSSSEFHYYLKFQKSHLYSDLFVSTVYDKIVQNPKYLEGCKKRYAEYRKSIRHNRRRT